MPYFTWYTELAIVIENLNVDDKVSQFTAIIITACLLLIISAEIFMIVIVSMIIKENK